LAAEVYHRHIDDLTGRERAGLIEILAARLLDAEDREKEE
jgi:hypothetical protein